MNNSTTLPYLICEVANCHGGDAGHLDEIIESFAEIDWQNKGIKFQAFSADMIALPDYSWYAVYKELVFTKEEWKNFILKSSLHGEVWLDIFDVYGVDIFSANKKQIKGIKLQASVLNNMEVFNVLMAEGMEDKSLILNISGHEITDIESAISRFNGYVKNIILQIGFQSYPTTISDTGLGKIKILNAAFPDLEICIADHAEATTESAKKIPVYGFLLGANFIEKHFCASRDKSNYDSVSALEPKELNEMCAELRTADSAISGYFINSAEKEYLQKSLQVPVLKYPKVKGDLLGEADFYYRRTGQRGIDANSIANIQKTKKVLSKNKACMQTVIEEDFRDCNIGVVVAGRMKSSRLPRKATLLINNITSIERCLKQCLGIASAAKVILATSDLESDDVLTQFTMGGKVTVWRGSPDDVISRYIGACDNEKIDMVVRVTADCPLVLPDIIEFLLHSHFDRGADYTAAEQCAPGTSGEIINTNALKRIANHFGFAKHSEYMTWYFQNNNEFFKTNIVALPDRMVRDYRLTLDYQEDLECLEEIFRRLPANKDYYTSDDVFQLLDKNKDIASMNSHLKLSYRTDQELIALLDKETKMK